MPYKNDDFEKLFQKAARHYPLNTDNANWNNLATRLENSKRIALKKNRWKYSIIFLVTVLVIGSLSVNKLLISNKQIVQAEKSFQKKATNLNSNLVIENKSFVQQKNLTTNAFTSNNLYEKISDPIKTNSLSVPNNRLEYDDLLTDNNYINIIPEKIYIPIEIDSNKERTLKSGGLFLNKNVSAANELNKAQIENAKLKEEKLIHVNTKQEYRIYGVAYGGPEFSIVKFQKATAPGYRAGIAIGYNINKSFSVELGLQREHVNFYSDGKYVDTSLLRIKKNTEVEQANVSSKITSVPLTLRYNFPSKNNEYFFASVGVNALIITHSEKYNYEVSKNGIEGSLSKNYNALTNPKYFSGFNISVGYQAKVVKTWSIKVEPYYQTPVKNFGVGKLPVSNFGVDIGIVKQLK